MSTSYDVKLDESDAEWLGRGFANILHLAIYLSYKRARKGKRKTYDEHEFEVRAYENIKKLLDYIENRIYRPGRSTAHIVVNPVIREIFAALFRDRVVHHLIYLTVYDWWDKHFIYDSYSCREGKGTLLGIMRLDYFIRKASQNYAKKVYVFKGDLQGFFMSLPRKELYREAMKGLYKQFKGNTSCPEYKLIAFLWYQIIMDDPVHGARRKGNLKLWKRVPRSKSLFCQRLGYGIVIGNLTSQLLSNIYLNQLDRFIVYELGYKYYGRYVDDFYIVIPEEQLPQFKKDIVAIEEFLKSKKLKLHPRKRILQESSKGVEFLGARVYHNRIVIGERLRKNIPKAFREVAAGVRDVDTVASYLGHVKHFNSYKMMKAEFEKVGWRFS